MFGFGKRQEPPAGPRVSTKLCTDSFNGKYPHVGLYDTRERKIWVCKPLSGQAIRTSHARLINGYPIDWEEGQLLVRIDPNWDYDRQRLIPAELEDQVNENLERQFKHGEKIFDFFSKSNVTYPFS